MDMQYRRLLDSVTLSAGDVVDLTGALDLGQYRELHIVVTIHQAGEAQEGESVTLSVKHAAINEEALYLDFETPAEVSLTSAGTSWFHASTFTRYVWWFVSGTLLSDAVVTLDLVGKG